MDWATIEGTPFPLGATWVEQVSSWNFALYSKDAEGVTLLLYTEADLVSPIFTYRFDYLRNKSGRIWHCRIAEAAVRGARYYAYSVDGPQSPGGSAWHCFDPDKVLLDPYARAVFFPPDFDRAAASRPGSNAGKAPLGLLVKSGEGFDWGDDRRPRHQADTVIYELQVRGFTNNPNSGVSPERRGTYAGVIEKIPYLKKLGVTAVELMPVFQYDPQEGSCWGYMPLNFFAPHDGYSSRQNEQVNEFRAMVKALHAADIEVILDVVYNHTAEGDRRGPVYSFKGIDNSGYYLLSGDPDQPYMDFSGTGNTLRCSNPAVRRMIVDSARYWVEEMHVDGFRVDLASALVRNDDGSLHWDDPIDLLPPNPLDIRFIAEPWDAAGAYLLGRSFPAKGCLQWNGRFRDDVRRFVRGDPPGSNAAISIAGVEGLTLEPVEANAAISITGSAGRRSRCEPLRPVIVAKLEQGLTAQRIWQDLTAEHNFTDSYQSVQRFVRTLRSATPMPFRRMECEPGDEAQIDFGRGAPLILPPDPSQPGSKPRRRATHLFRIVLSRRISLRTAEMFSTYSATPFSQPICPFRP